MPNVYRYIEFNEHITGDEIRIELLKDGFTGAPSEMLARGDFFDFVYDQIDWRNPYDAPIQKSRLNVDVLVRDQADLDVLDEIFSAQQGQFFLRKKISGQTQWTGEVLGDLLKYSESPFPFGANITAKDLSYLDVPSSYGLQTGFPTIIEGIAEILSGLGLGIDIATYTNWQYQNESGDYLGYTSFLRNALRDFGRDSDIPISNFEALERILRSHKLLLKQSGGRWRVYHISALKKPTSVTENIYDSDGSFQSSNSVNLVSSGENYIQRTSNNTVGPALKQVTSRFDHRTQIGSITIPERVTLTTEDESYSQTLFLSDGGQGIEFEGFIRAFVDDADDVSASIEIQAAQYYWDGSDWTETESDIDINLAKVDPSIWQSTFKIITGNIPADADGTLTVTIKRGFFTSDLVPGGDWVDDTLYRDMDFAILNPSVEDGDSIAVINELTQTGDFLGVYDSGDEYFGDGPASYSYSRLGIPPSTRTDLDGKWRFQGEADEWIFSELGLKEIMAWRRTRVRTIRADLLGEFDPSTVLEHEGSYYFFLGGGKTGRTNKWRAFFTKIQFSDEADTFVRYYETRGTGTGSSPIGGGGGGGDIDNFDDRYYRHTQLLSETPSGSLGELRTNIGLGTGDAPDFSGVDISGSNFVDSLRNVTANDIRLDSGKFLSPVDFSFRNAGDTAFRSISIAQASNADHAVAGGRTISSGDGLSGGGDLTTDRTLSVNPTAPITLTAGQVDLSFNDPLYLNGTDLDVRVHGSGQAGILSTGLQNIYGRKQFQSESQFLDDIFLDKGQKWDDNNSFIQTETFAGEFSGSGARWGWDPKSGRWKLTTDDLVVRNRARFYELVIERIRSVGGTIIINEGMEVEEVDKIGDGSETWDSTAVTWGDTDVYWGDTWNCYVEEDILIEFVEDDLIKRQEYTGRSIAVTEATVTAIETGDANPEVNTPRRYFRVFTESGSDAPADGNEFVRIGNRTDPDRQNGIIITASDSGSPYRRIYAGVDSFERFGDFDTLKLQDGRLDNIIDPDFPTLDGSQTNLFGIWTNGGFFNNVEVRGQITILNPASARNDLNVADGATFGADWDNNLANIPGTLEAPSGTGLFLSSTHMGYYDDGTWKTYIDSSGNMILGDHANENTGLSWNQSLGTLGVKGEIVITSGSGYDNITDKPTEIGDINATEGTKLTGIESGADVTGNNTASDIANLPATPSGTGLFASATRLGFYDDNNWIHYLENDGTFQFGGTDGISYAGSGWVELGSDTLIKGNLSVAQTSAINPAGLEGLWRFDAGSGSTAIDSTGNNDGTLQGNPTWITDSPTGGGLEFDGSNEEVVADNPFSGDQEEFTVVIWAKELSTQSGNEGLIQLSGPSNYSGGVVITVNGSSSYRIREWNDGGDNYTFSTPNRDSWHQVVAVFDNGNIKVYYNTELVLNTSYNTGFNFGTSLHVARYTYSTNYYHGIFTSPRIYSRALEEREIKSLYANPSGNSGGKISADTVVATEAFFQELFAYDVDIENVLTMKTGRIENEAESYRIDDQGIAINGSNLLFNSETGTGAASIDISGNGSLLSMSTETAAMTWNFNGPSSGVFKIQNISSLQHRIRYANVDGGTHDYSIGDQSWQILNPTSFTQVSGIQAHNNREIVMTNQDSSNDIQLMHDNTGSDRGNRIYTNTGVDVNITGGASAILRYDPSADEGSGKWRVIAIS